MFIHLLFLVLFAGDNSLLCVVNVLLYIKNVYFGFQERFYSFWFSSSTIIISNSCSSRMAGCKTVCFYNNKGGVGKTTLACNYAVELAMREPQKKVLMVDMDCQINTTCFCLGGGTRGLIYFAKLLSLLYNNSMIL